MSCWMKALLAQMAPATMSDAPLMNLVRLDGRGGGG
jgi:hypothetical protein